MIWIKNHGISGESDNLRIPLRDANADVYAHIDNDETTPITALRGWTGVHIDLNAEQQRCFSEALEEGHKLRWAIGEPADHPDFDNKAEELDAYYDGTHPDLDDTS